MIALLRYPVMTLCMGLFGAWLAGRFARFHWTLDLLSHFPLQYLLCAVVLAAAALLLRLRPAAILCGIVALFCLGELTWLYADHGGVPRRLAPAAASLTVVTYNRANHLTDHRDMVDWLRRNKDRFDAVLIQEAGRSHMQAAATLRDAFPHQRESLGAVFISRLPILETREFPLPNDKMPKMLWRIGLKAADGAPVTVYALHTFPPLGVRASMFRNRDLGRAAAILAEDNSPRRLIMGDLNITPFSPVFKDFLRNSGLTYGYHGWLPTRSWPEFVGTDWLRIPLDYVLYNGGMQLLRQRPGPAMGSDHRPMIAQFVLTPNSSPPDKVAR